MQIPVLGKNGVTLSCVQAMAAILTSSFECREVTIIFKKKGRKEDIWDICFLVWEWCQMELVIVSDGFRAPSPNSNYRGTGYAGFVAVLQLLRQNHILTSDKTVDDELFERINEGELSEDDIKALAYKEPGSSSGTYNYSWLQYEESHTPNRWLEFMNPVRFPTWLVDENIITLTSEIESKPSKAILSALIYLEDLIRSKGGFTKNDFGSRLIKKSMQGEQAPLVPKTDNSNESEGWVNIFLGVFSAWRNRFAHHEEKLNTKDAYAYMITVCMLIRKINTDYPD